MEWIIRSNVKVDRVACPWLIRRFIDPQAEFLFVPEDELLEAAHREGRLPSTQNRFPEVKVNRRGDRCTFEACPRSCCADFFRRTAGIQESAGTASHPCSRHCGYRTSPPVVSSLGGSDANEAVFSTICHLCISLIRQHVFGKRIRPNAQTDHHVRPAGSGRKTIRLPHDRCGRPLFDFRPSRCGTDVCDRLSYEQSRGHRDRHTRCGGRRIYSGT